MSTQFKKFKELTPNEVWAQYEDKVPQALKAPFELALLDQSKILKVKFETEDLHRMLAQTIKEVEPISEEESKNITKDFMMIEFRSITLVLANHAQYSNAVVDPSVPVDLNTCEVLAGTPQFSFTVKGPIEYIAKFLQSERLKTVSSAEVVDCSSSLLQ